MKKRITIDIPNEDIKTLSIEAIEQGTKLKMMLEKQVIKLAETIRKKSKQ